MKKPTALVAALVIGGCSSVGTTVDSQGKAASKVVFPEQKDAWLEKGVFVNVDNLRSVGAGATKDNLYYLLGRPHFSEGMFFTKEWDYIFNFRKADGSVETCQYKVLFDKEVRAQSFYWQPESCANNLVAPKAKQVVVTKYLPAPVAKPKDKVIYRMRLDADALFAFDKAGVDDIKPNGKQKLSKLAIKVLEQKANNKDVFLKIVGHTDRLGDAGYNQKLSEARASTVKSYLQRNGLSSVPISAYGMGESKPVVVCADGARAALIGCLQPNRRVDVEVLIHQ